MKYMYKKIGFCILASFDAIAPASVLTIYLGFGLGWDSKSFWKLIVWNDLPNSKILMKFV